MGGAIFGGGIAPWFHWRPLAEASQGPCNQTRTFTSQVSLPGSNIRRNRTGRSARLATKESSDSAFCVAV